MPRELKKRGRRAEKQRKEAETLADRPTKRRKTADFDQDQDFAVHGDAGDDFISFGHDQTETAQVDSETTFYGLLTEEEMGYYANVNNKISTNDFESEDDRNMFIEAVYRESAGKEIKIASSQSCSRHLEKVIRLSSPSQLSSLFEAFLQDLNYLVQHRFGSHCCESLFAEAAKYIDPSPKGRGTKEELLEDKFLGAVEALKPNIGYLLTERFASHTLRVLLLVLSGQPLEQASVREVIASRKKEHVDITRIPEEASTVIRKTPASFRTALQDLIHSAIGAVDATYLRALATHPTGNPMLQLLLRLELSDNDANKVVLQRLIPDQNFEPDSESSKFISGLVYDATGAYLVETLARYLPGKIFKKMYKNLFRERIGKLAKNEIASYVAIAIFERVGKDDLIHASESVIPELSGLIERHRLAVVKSLIERCNLRGVDLGNFKSKLSIIYGSEAVSVLPKMLSFEIVSDDLSDETSRDESSVAHLQGSLLAQSLLQIEQLCDIVQKSLLAQPSEVLQRMAKNPIASRVLQVALTSEVSSNTFLRRFIPRFFETIPGLAINPSGSHLVDALWVATYGSHFMKERIARILQDNERSLRESQYGRNVWRNWSMDVFQRRPREWQAVAKRTSLTASGEKESKLKKSSIDLARERHMQQKAKSNAQSKSAVVKASA